jgi:hypothetical protein
VLSAEKLQGVVHAMAGDDIDRGQVAGARALDLARGDLAHQLLGLHAEAAGFRSGDPVGDVLGLRALQGHALAQAGERLGLLADDLGQRLALDLELVLRGDLLRRGEVEARLRLMHVGDGDGADLEAGLGQLELLGCWPAQLRHRGERVLRVEHVEVGLGHAQHQSWRAMPNWVSASAVCISPCLNCTQFCQRNSGWVSCTP